jgi:hypothetical protein
MIIAAQPEIFLQDRPWILATGEWNDSGIWIDEETWIDGL